MRPLAKRALAGSTPAIRASFVRKFVQASKSAEPELAAPNEPPDPDAWNAQMYTFRVFDQLVYNTDSNLTNALVDVYGRFQEPTKLWRKVA